MFYTAHQFQVFSEDVPRAFLDLGFEVLEEPYIDHSLCGFRAAYIRRYLLENSSSLCDGLLNAVVHVIGLPFGHLGQKMIIISTPRSLANEQIAEATKLRLRFDDTNQCHVVNGHHQLQSLHQNLPVSQKKVNDDIKHLFDCRIERLSNRNQSNQQSRTSNLRFASDLITYVKHLIQVISPGLISLPPEIKLEILKKLSVHSVVKMSQVNNEFRSIIFKHGETLWRHLCLRDFNIRDINRLVHRSWMELYRDSYIYHQIETCRKERALPGLPERPALPPVPHRLQIEWLPQVLELPLYPLDEVAHHQQVGHQLQLAIEMMPLRRADSLDSVH